MENIKMENIKNALLAYESILKAKYQFKSEGKNYEYKYFELQAIGAEFILITLGFQNECDDIRDKFYND